jgi:putative ABC transport system ATP-binding protein
MIKLEGITKKYIGKHIYSEVLKGVNLNIKESDFVAIMGRSGTGKTTLLNIIGCMDNYDCGAYYFNTVSVKNLSSKEFAQFRNNNIGFVFQSFQLIPELDVITNVELPMGLANVPKNTRKKRAYELLKDVGLEEKAYHKPIELSGGQQQRVAIARALANSPKVILADEPTGNLDEESGFQIMEYFRNLNKKEKVTIIIVTHDIEVAHYADYIIEMRDGVISKTASLVI